MYKREQIKTAYTITRAGKAGMGVLPSIDPMTTPKGSKERKLAQAIAQAAGVATGAAENRNEAARVAANADGTLQATRSAHALGSTAYNLADVVEKVQEEQNQVQQATLERKRASTTGVMSRLKPCQRFMDRSNLPVNSHQASDAADTHALVKELE